MAAIMRLRFTPSRVPLTWKTKKQTSTRTPKRKAKKNVNGPSEELASAVSNPPIAPTYIAPTLWINSELRASRTA